MKNSNRLHRLFSKGKLSREDIHDYKNSSGLKQNSIEQKSMEHQFDSDAMDGWESVNFSTDMSKLDKQFAPKPTNWIYWTTGAIGVILVTGLIFINPFSRDEITSNISVQDEPKEIIIEKTDIVLPDSINDLVELPEEKQILKEVLIPQKEVQNKENIEPVVTEPKEVSIEPIPINKIETTAPEIIFHQQKKAKELYFNDFKLVDYRSYRSKPTVTVEKMVLGGTPANKEDENSEVFEYEWQDYDVPYIEYIEKTTAYLSKKRMKKALQRCQTILETYPDDINANFYAGFCLMNLNELKKAITHFDKVNQHDFSNFNEESEWLKAICLEELAPVKAQELLRKISDSGGFYAVQAQEKLK